MLPARPQASHNGWPKRHAAIYRLLGNMLRKKELCEKMVQRNIPVFELVPKRNLYKLTFCMGVELTPVASFYGRQIKLAGFQMLLIVHHKLMGHQEGCGVREFGMA